jgi:hypothetical protein
LNYKNEKQMYSGVVNWLQQLLVGKFQKATIEVKDTHASPLNEYILRHGLHNYFTGDQWRTYDIQVDITAFIQSSKVKGLVFVECKIVDITLLHISQLLGYSRVALPLSSYLISSKGIGGSVNNLITIYDRSDILEYQWTKGEIPKSIIIAKWDISSNCIDSNLVLPPGSSGQL